MRRTVDAHQANRRGNCRLCLFGRRALQIGKRGKRGLVANLPQRRYRIVLQWTFEFGDLDQLAHRGRDLVVAQRFDHRAAKVIEAAARIANQGVGDGFVFRRHRGQGANQGRANEFTFFLVQRRQQLRIQRRLGMLLEISVRDFAQAIVGRGHRLDHRVHRAWIAETGQQRQRLEANEAVAVLVDRLKQGGNGLRRRRTPDHAGGIHARGVVEITELVDGLADLLRGRRSGPAFLGADADAHDGRDHEHAVDGGDQEGASLSQRFPALLQAAAPAFRRSSTTTAGSHVRRAGTPLDICRYSRRCNRPRPVL